MKRTLLVAFVSVALVAAYSAESAFAKIKYKTVCAKQVCVVVAYDDGGGLTNGTADVPKVCLHDHSTVLCENLNGTYDSADGCYHRAVSPGNVTGPVRKEFDSRGGSIVFASCPFGGTGGFLWQPPAKPVVTAALVRARVVRLIPSAAVGLAPKAATLVNIQTVMWVDAPVSQDLAAVQILGQRVLIHLSVDSVHYAFGDGASEVGPVGKAYDEAGDVCKTRLCPDYYGHVYTERGVRTVSARAFWRASFTVDGGGRVQIPGTVPGPASQARVTVREARAVLVPTP